MPVGKLEQATPLVLKHHPARWDCRGEQTYSNCVRAHTAVGDIRPSRREIVFDETVDVIRRRAGQERRTLVDLIERIGNDHRRADTTRVDDRLRKRKQRLAAAEHRQHLRCRIERDQSVTALEPRGDRLAQRGRARRCGIIREPFAPAASASSSNRGVGWRGSPIDRLIGAFCGFGTTLAKALATVRTDTAAIARGGDSKKWRAKTR